MVHWWILGAGFPIDTGDHGGCWYGHSKEIPCRLESLRLKFTNEPSIFFCRWGFGWVDKAQCFRSARRFGAAGSSPDFSRGFSRHGAPRPLICLELSFNVIFFVKAFTFWETICPRIITVIDRAVLSCLTLLLSIYFVCMYMCGVYMCVFNHSCWITAKSSWKIAKRSTSWWHAASRLVAESPAC